MILELSLLGGRYHATPWGRHPNEAAAEWPPSPFRLLRALVDAWYRKHPALDAEVVERALRAIAAPPSFWLPPACQSHTRAYLSQNKEDLTKDKQLVFDGFVVVDRGARIVAGWPGVTLDEEAARALRLLAESVGYLGRSESWVRMSIADDREVAWNCRPLGNGAVEPGVEVVTVAGVAAPAHYDARPFVVPARGKQKARTLPWLEALTWGSAEVLAHTMDRPPAMEPLFYTRAVDALDARPPPTRRPEVRTVEVAAYALECRVPVPVTEAVHVGEQVRRRLLGALRAIVGDARGTPLFTGKDASGRPLVGHVHASILPLDADGDGYLDRLLVVSPRALGRDEQRALDRLRPLPRKHGHPLIVTPIRYGTREELLQRATELVSHTPFAPPHHFRSKRDGDLGTWLGRQLRLEAERRGLPAIVHIERVARPIASRRSMRWLDFRRARKSDAPRPAFGLKITFAEPVLAPLSLGYASHFGLGIFVAASTRDNGGSGFDDARPTPFR